MIYAAQQMIGWPPRDGKLWDIVDSETLEVLAVVKTKREAQRIVKAQQVPQPEREE